MRLTESKLDGAYSTIAERNEALATPIAMSRNQQIVPIAPRKYSPQQIYIKLANVPIYPEEQVRKLIKDYWDIFGVTGAVEPHYIKETKKLTRRWDLVRWKIPQGTSDF